MPQGARWGSWETWSSCSQTCSRGFRTRKRACSTSQGRTNPAACVGSPVEYQDCSLQACPGTNNIYSGLTVFMEKLEKNKTKKKVMREQNVLDNCWLCVCFSEGGLVLLVGLVDLLLELRRRTLSQNEDLH